MEFNYIFPLFASNPDNVEQVEAEIYELFKPLVDELNEIVQARRATLPEDVFSSMSEIADDFKAGNISKHFAVYPAAGAIMPETYGARMACAKLDMIINPEKYHQTEK